MTRRKVSALVVLLGLVGVAGCSDGAGGGGAAALCAQDLEVETDVPVFRSADPSMLSLDEMRGYLVALDGWLAEVSDAAGASASAQYDEFQVAVQGFGDVVQALPEDPDFDDGSAVRDAAQEVQRTGQELFEAAGC